MNKTLLVLSREYLSRVRKPSFWVITIVVPILLAAIYAIPVILASRPAEHAHVLVVDDSGLFQGEFRSSRSITYHPAGSIDYARRQLSSVDSLDAIVFIPARETSIPQDAFLYYQSHVPSPAVQADVNAQLQQILHNRILLDVHGISPDEYAMLTSTAVRLRTQDIESGREGHLQVRLVLASILAVLIFLTVVIFGSQVMRGVMEEKSSRIVEIIVCSVKPFQLMMGKVVGIALVGLTQITLWVVLATFAIVGIRAGNASLFQEAEGAHPTQLATKGTEATRQYQAAQIEAARYEAGEGIDHQVQTLFQSVSDINFPLTLTIALYYFLFGYLLYASLFAAVGSLAGSETDAQPFSIPLSLPLLLVILLIPFISASPSGPLATWLSIIPFTSPVAMPFRIPFGVPIWQVVLSMVLLFAVFPLCVWGAARIYRHALLRYGQRASWITFFRLLGRGEK